MNYIHGAACMQIVLEPDKLMLCDAVSPPVAHNRFHFYAPYTQWPQLLASYPWKSFLSCTEVEFSEYLPYVIGINEQMVGSVIDYRWYEHLYGSDISGTL